MKALVSFTMLCLICPASFTQEPTLIDVNRELDAARDELKKVVTMCRSCRGSGQIEGQACPQCDGRGAMLKSEAKLLAQRAQLEQTAEQKGVSKDTYADFDIAGRLTKYNEQMEPEAFALLKGYVGYVKVCRKYKDLIDQDEKLARQTAESVEHLDKLIDRHARHLTIRSLEMLYEDDPTGKVGAFRFYGTKGVVRIAGEEYSRIQMRTLKTHDILLNRSRAKPRAGFVLAEIVGKGTYQSDDGKSISGVLLQAY